MALGALAALGISAGVQGLNSIIGGIHSSPMHQIKRLKKAGLSPNAIFSGVDTGSIQPNLNVGSPAELMKAGQEKTIFDEGSGLIAEEAAFKGVGTGWGKHIGNALAVVQGQKNQKNIRVTERLGKIAVDREAAALSRSGVKKNAQDISASKTGQEKTRVETENLRKQGDKLDEEVKALKFSNKNARTDWIAEKLQQASGLNKEQVETALKTLEYETTLRQNKIFNELFDFIHNGGSPGDIKGMIQRTGELVQLVTGELGKALSEMGNGIADKLISFIASKMPEGGVISDLPIMDLINGKIPFSSWKKNIEEYWDKLTNKEAE